MRKALLILMATAVLLTSLPFALAGCSSKAATVRAGGADDLYLAPQPETLQDPPGQISGGSKVRVLATQGVWTMIQQGGLKGWIPTWYLSDDPTPVKELQSEGLVLADEASIYLYPDGPAVGELPGGKVLKPFKEWNDWVQVRITVYSVPGVQTAWIMRKMLTTPNQVEPKEGYLYQGTEAFQGEFDQITGTKPDVLTHPLPVWITEQKGGYLRVSAAGGWIAWVKKDSFRLTPPS
ncbi:MAG TPA: hypothetical protein VGL40_12990 [Bacillota bacterium]